MLSVARKTQQVDATQHVALATVRNVVPELGYLPKEDPCAITVTEGFPEDLPIPIDDVSDVLDSVNLLISPPHINSCHGRHQHLSRTIDGLPIEVALHPVSQPLLTETLLE